VVGAAANAALCAGTDEVLKSATAARQSRREHIDRWLDEGPKVFRAYLSAVVAEQEADLAARRARGPVVVEFRTGVENVEQLQAELYKVAAAADSAPGSLAVRIPLTTIPRRAS
jgi:hypothetical protein